MGGASPPPPRLMRSPTQKASLEMQRQPTILRLPSQKRQDVVGLATADDPVSNLQVQHSVLCPPSSTQRTLTLFDWSTSCTPTVRETSSGSHSAVAAYTGTR